MQKVKAIILDTVSGFNANPSFNIMAMSLECYQPLLASQLYRQE